LAVYDSVEEALDAEPRPPTPSINDTLLPASGAARHARDLVSEGCRRWDLAHLTGRAQVVANELVTNAVVHAQTMINFRVTLGRRYSSWQCATAVTPSRCCRRWLRPTRPAGADCSW